jgi:predicted metal-dependent peptidase
MDEMLSPNALAAFNVRGYGGSDLSPAMIAFGADAQITAAIIITDGDITYPPDPVPYSVLWVVPGLTTPFAPAYGRVVTLPREEQT